MALKRSTGLRDKLNGIKTNAITNGAFTADAAGWTPAGATFVSSPGGQAGNCGLLTNNAASAGFAYQDVATVAGRVYKFTGYFKKGSATGGVIKIGTAADDDAYINSGSLADVDFALKTFVFIAATSSTRITLANVSAVNGDTSLFDTLVMEEILDGFVEIFRNCKCNIYSAPQPANADTGATGTLLCTVTLNGTATGLTFNDSSSGVVTKPSGDVWKGTNVATGTAAWFRFYEEGDTPSATSTVAARMDGTITLTGGGGQMIAADTALVSGLEFSVTGFTYTPSS